MVGAAFTEIAQTLTASGDRRAEVLYAPAAEGRISAILRKMHHGLPFLAEEEGRVGLGLHVGPTLVVEELGPQPHSVAGKFFVSSVIRVDPEGASASPAVLYWMKFNGKLHKLEHRYDNAIARHPIDAVSRAHVTEHVLRSFSFYEAHAFSDAPFPGYTEES